MLSKDIHKDLVFDGGGEKSARCLEKPLDPDDFSARFQKIMNFWSKKEKRKDPPEKAQPAKEPKKSKLNGKQKVANQKMRIQGKFITYEAALQLLNDKKRLKEMNI
jgi:hypothetical protein